MKDRIKVDNWVSVYFDHAPNIEAAEVLYMPAGPGDSWHLRDEDGKIFYVQSYSLIEKIGDANG